MARYQKHYRNATSPGLEAVIFFWEIKLLAAVCLGMMLVVGGSLPVRAQQSAGISQQLYIVPAEKTAIELHAHIVRQQVRVEGGAIGVDVAASYQLRNKGDKDVAVILRLLPGEGGEDRIQGVTLAGDGQFLPVQTGETGGYVSQVTLGADSDAVLNLNYRSNLGDGVLSTIRYAPGWLNQWPGPVSTRLDIMLPDAVVAGSGVRVTPDSWTDAPASAGETGFRWVSDVSSAAEYVVQFVRPDVWSEIQAAQPARRGELYRQLAAATDEAEVRDRFYAQALAAYSAGLAGAAVGDPAAAQLHQGLAGLYRTHVTSDDGATAVAYAKAMVQETEAALAGMAEGDARRAELEQWQADGLQLLLREAKVRQDWEGAMQVVERLARLPAQAEDPAGLDAERRGIVVQQALQLLNQGNAQAAFALAGPAIAGPELAAPADAQSLFQSWEITVTASPAQVEVSAAAQPNSGQSAAAEAALQNVAAVWQAAAERVTSTPGALRVEAAGSAQDGGGTARLTLSASLPLDGAALASLLPAGNEWALLHGVLAGLAPVAERSGRLWWQRTALSQPADLQGVGRQWMGMATDLERRATELEMQGQTLGATDAEVALQAQIQAANLRAAADIWKGLARSSWVQYRLQLDQPAAGGESEPVMRAWYLTVESPSQMLRLNAQDIHAGIFLGAAALALMGLIGAAGVLWSLL